MFLDPRLDFRNRSNFLQRVIMTKYWNMFMGYRYLIEQNRLYEEVAKFSVGLGYWVQLIYHVIRF